LSLAKVRPEVAHYFQEAPPMKRIGQPEDLTGGLVYLLSDAASYVTGIDLAIDGGMSTGNGLTR
jgi:NAD(P)-dependent dehydrogenase (short-subunit alcohol dehydrogenase family)